jgi:excisionase family DNA binding protein
MISPLCARPAEARPSIEEFNVQSFSNNSNIALVSIACHTHLEMDAERRRRRVTEGQPVDLSLAIGGGETRNITLMPALTDTLLDILRLISTGRGFRMIPVEAELTTQEAADMLNVSRPFLIKLLEKGDIRFTTVGRHRRVRAEDLFAYMAERDQTRSDALSELAGLDAEGDLI